MSPFACPQTAEPPIERTLERYPLRGRAIDRALDRAPTPRALVMSSTFKTCTGVHRYTRVTGVTCTRVAGVTRVAQWTTKL